MALRRRGPLGNATSLAESEREVVMRLRTESKELLQDLPSDEVVNGVGLIPSSIGRVGLWIGVMDEAGRGALNCDHQATMILQRGLWETNQS